MPVETTPATRLRLVEVLDGPLRGMQYVWTGSRMIIGREQDCQVKLQDAAVSRHHCVLLQDDYAVRVRDLGSRNGTFLQGKRVSGEQILLSGDVLTIGQTQLKFQEEAQGTTASHQPTAVDVSTTRTRTAQILM
ncbi:FHA domain-containing protein [bacterium]|nr:FHA domain-containing protein [bacterium]